MRVVLVNPAHPGIRPQDEEESLGLGYLAAVARRAGHEVAILDATPYRLPPRRIADIVTGRDPFPGEEPPPAAGGVGRADLVGVSVLFQELIPSAMAVVGALRRAGFEGHVAIGGHPPTFLHQELRRDYRGFDSVVVGEGEETFTELLGALQAGRDWTGTPGLVAAGPPAGPATTPPTGDEPAARSGPVPRPLIADLDTLPFPARDTLRTHLRHRGPRVASILRSRGCYGHCSFCDTRAFYAASPGRAWRVRSAPSVVEEMAVLARDHGVERIRFWDDNFMGPGRQGREAAENLAREMLKRDLKLPFSMECRATDIEVDLFRLLKEAGLHRVFLGLEAANPRQLELYAKEARPEDNRRALRGLEEVGIDVTVGMIMFDPDTTLEELSANLDFLRETFGGSAAVREKVARPWNRLEIYSGTPIEKTLRERGRLRGDYVRLDYEFSDPAVARLYRSGALLRRLGLPLRDAVHRFRRGRPA